MKKKDLKLSVIGLGYVGLPLAIEFSRKRSVLGFDINQQRIEELESGNDSTLETTQEELTSAKELTYTNNPDDLSSCNCFIVFYTGSNAIRNKPIFRPVSTPYYIASSCNSKFIFIIIVKVTIKIGLYNQFS